MPHRPHRALLASVSAAVLTACATGIPRPRPYDSSAPASVLRFGAAPQRHGDRLTPCLNGISDARGHALDFSREAVLDAGSLELNAGSYVLSVSRCFVTCPETRHERLQFDAKGGVLYRVTIGDLIETPEGDSFTLSVVDEGTGASVAQARGHDCWLPPESM